MRSGGAVICQHAHEGRGDYTRRVVVSKPAPQQLFLTDAEEETCYQLRIVQSD